MSDESTAVTRQDERPELPQAQKNELQAIRQAGQYAVERQKEINAVTKMMAGMQFGNVRGENLSPETRYAIARVCEQYGADPAIHIHILGGNLYLNAQFWAERVNGLPNLKGWEQFNISALYSAELRKQAKQMLADSKEYEVPEWRDQGLKLIEAANKADQRRAYFGIPDTAVAAYETVIDFTDRASVYEANYAPNSGNDPVGKARPNETARSRSLRRAGAKASPAIKSLDELAARQEIKAEFRVIEADAKEARQALPAAGEAQAVRIGAGEPQAANVAQAQELPKQELGTTARPAKSKKSEVAEALALATAKEQYEKGCVVMGIEDPTSLEFDILGHGAFSLSDYEQLNAALAAMGDRPTDEQGAFLS